MQSASGQTVSVPEGYRRWIDRQRDSRLLSDLFREGEALLRAGGHTTDFNDRLLLPASRGPLHAGAHRLLQCPLRLVRYGRSKGRSHAYDTGSFASNERAGSRSYYTGDDQRLQRLCV